MRKYNKTRKKVELLAPAGNLAKLKYALHYGADAVYCGLPDFSLRVRINQFTKDDLVEAIKFVHEKKKKIYVTLNIYAHNRHLEEIRKHLKWLDGLGKLGLGVDGVIVSDPGIINLVQKYLPEVEIHLSTQANATNWEAVKFWKNAGVKRVILARELSLGEIMAIEEKVKGVELETFVHGAMCMSYSGRCILSKWMSGRSANLGDCTQPCRWPYHATRDMQHATRKKSVIDDQKRYEMDVEEDNHGTYFFNSYDLNSIEQVKGILEAGVVSLKIEGRAKSVYYVAVVTRAYRKVIDAIEKRKNIGKVIKEQKEELNKLVHRGYTTGFLLGGEPQHNFSGKLHGGDWEFVGEVDDVGDVESVEDVVNEGNGERDSGKGNWVKVHNAVFLSDEIEAVTPNGNISVKIKRIVDWNKKEVSEAHGGHEKRYYFSFDKKLEVGSLLRRKER